MNIHRISILFFSIPIVFVVLCSSLAGQEWTRFRGPNGSGLSPLMDFPSKWEDTNFIWKVELPGKGHSSPVLWGEMIFLLSADSETATQYVLCLSAVDGEILWQRSFPSTPHTLHERNTYASSTPVVDAERVYVAWSNPSVVTLMALDHEGAQIWVRDLGSWTSMHGFGTSPIRYRDLVIISNSQQADGLSPGQSAGKSRVMAFEANSGELRWETSRESAYVCYSTPCLYYPARGEPQLINTSTKEGVYSLDPNTGKELWSFGDAFEMRVVSSPLIVEDLIYGSTGSGGGGNYVSAFRAGKEPELLYTIRRSAPYVPTVVAKDGMAFLFGDKGVVSCIEVETGKTFWQERVGSGFSGSPIILAGKVFIISDNGTVYVFAVSEKFQLLAENPLDEPTRSTPAVAGGRMFLRTESHLYSVGRSF